MEEYVHYQNGHLTYGPHPPAWITQGRAVLMGAESDDREAARKKQRIQQINQRIKAEREAM